MIRKTLLYSRTEAWSQGYSWSSLKLFPETWSRNWHLSQSYTGCWSHAKLRSNFVVGSIPRSWSHHI